MNVTVALGISMVSPFLSLWRTSRVTPLRYV